MTDTPVNPLPRWRGFNLMEMVTTKQSGRFVETDFAWIAELGFDFVRLPLSYRLWTDADDPRRIDETVLAEVDRGVALGRQHGLHVSINFHRAPGFCVNPPPEPFNLWKDAEALDAFCFHWRRFAERFADVPGDALSFNPVNEPTDGADDGMTRADHERVMRAVVKTLREVDPDRLIIIDGLAWGKEPLPELVDLAVAQSCRAYWPHALSHWRAHWVKGKEDAPAPTWPGVIHRGETWDRARIAEHYRPWGELARSGVGVHCGEGGCFNRTPHAVFLAWFRDVLDVLTSHGIGYALWNFRGPFGILDPGREDVVYEEWHGHKLDRKLLELLREF
ncbi:MAG TPA: cellulase family glycosylhydrolase [Planctomycetota bacterium]|nr:cellulase family glycosylhydrolase [Planctomycetota bacterium]